MKMIWYEFNCMICKTATKARRKIGVAVPRFCSKECYQSISKSWLNKTKFIFAKSTPEERSEHIKNYYNKNVIKKDGCWDWSKECKTDRYPRMDHARGMPKISIHRASWMIHKGEIPKGLYVLHMCDNTRCSNPDHLFLGTALDNNRDCINKGRYPFSTHGNLKLKVTDILQIQQLLKEKIEMHEIAKKFNVSWYTIYRIREKKDRYKNIF